jgi:hypothetical protein
MCGDPTHWEDMDIYRWAMSVIQYPNTIGKNPKPVDVFNTLYFQYIHAQIWSEIKTKHRGDLFWGFKSPTTMYLLPFWLRYLLGSPEGEKVVFVEVRRNYNSIKRGLRLDSDFLYTEEEADRHIMWCVRIWEDVRYRHISDSQIVPFDFDKMYKSPQVEGERFLERIKDMGVPIRNKIVSFDPSVVKNQLEEEKVKSGKEN